MGAPCNVIMPSGELKYVPAGVTVTDWPKPDKPSAPELGTSGFVFNGQAVPKAGEGYLTTLYGSFEGDARYSLALAESADGYQWRIRDLPSARRAPDVRVPDGVVRALWPGLE